MLLRARHDGRVYEVELPAGSRVEASPFGGAVIVVSGGSPGATGFSIPRASLLEFARAGRFGLVLRGEIAPRAAGE